MWKIVAVLALAALAVLTARLITDAAFVETRTGALSIEAPAEIPPLMYAGIRG